MQIKKAFLMLALALAPMAVQATAPSMGVDRDYTSKPQANPTIGVDRDVLQPVLGVLFLIFR